MVNETLTNEMITAGAELTNRMDNFGMEVRASLWVYISDGNGWHLMIATPQVNSQGPKKVYRRIQSIIAKMANDGYKIGVSDVMVVGPDYYLVRLLRNAVGTGVRDVSGIRFSRNTINGVFIEDAYIYRSA
jgi:hypothetical protein